MGNHDRDRRNIVQGAVASRVGQAPVETSREDLARKVEALVRADPRPDSVRAGLAALYLRGDIDTRDLYVVEAMFEGSRLLTLDGPRLSDSAGDELRPGVRDRLKAIFGRDLSGIRVHVGPEATDIAKGFHAEALSSGGDIFLADAAKAADEALLAHEVVHALSGLSRVALKKEDNPPAQPEMSEEEKQWRADWNDEALEKWRSHFGGESNYLKLCPLYKAVGVLRPLKYATDNIVEITFLGHKTPGHKDLKAKMEKAEALLKERCAAKGKPVPTLKSVWAFTPRAMASNKNKLSNHALGKAVDFDPDQNPMLVKDSLNLAEAVSGMDLHRSNQGFDEIKAASDSFKANYNIEGLTRRINACTEQLQDLDKALKDLDTSIALLKTKAATGMDAQQLKRLTEEKKRKQDARKRAVDMLDLLNKAKDKLIALSEVQDSLKILEQERDGLDKEISNLKQAIAELPPARDAEQAERAKQLNAELTTAQQKNTAKDAEIKKAKEKVRQLSPPAYAKTGFLNLDRDLVNAMIDAGIEWGGNWKSNKDLMHFEVK